MINANEGITFYSIKNVFCESTIFVLIMFDKKMYSYNNIRQLLNK